MNRYAWRARDRGVTPAHALVRTLSLCLSLSLALFLALSVCLLSVSVSASFGRIDLSDVLSICRRLSASATHTELVITTSSLFSCCSKMLVNLALHPCRALVHESDIAKVVPLVCSAGMHTRSQLQQTYSTGQQPLNKGSPNVTYLHLSDCCCITCHCCASVVALDGFEQIGNMLTSRKSFIKMAQK